MQLSVQYRHLEATAVSLPRRIERENPLAPNYLWTTRNIRKGLKPYLSKGLDTFFVDAGANLATWQIAQGQLE